MSLGIVPGSIMGPGQLVGGPVDRPIFGNQRPGLTPPGELVDGSVNRPILGNQLGLPAGYTQSTGQQVAGPVAPAVEPNRQFEQYQPYFQQMRQNVTGLEEALQQFEQTMLPGQQGRSTGGAGGKLGTPGMF